MERNDLKSDASRDLTCMSFEELRLEAEALLKKYHTCGDRNEMRSISNRFSEIDSMLEDYQKKMNDDGNKPQEHNQMDTNVTPLDTSSLPSPDSNSPEGNSIMPIAAETVSEVSHSAMKSDSTSSATLVKMKSNQVTTVSMLDKIPLANILESDYDCVQIISMEMDTFTEPEPKTKTPVPSSPPINPVIEAAPAPVKSTPAPPKKPTSALDLIPMPEVEVSDDVIFAKSESESPVVKSNTSTKKKVTHYKGSGDLQSALQSVWKLVSDSEAPAVDIAAIPSTPPPTVEDSTRPELAAALDIPPIPELSVEPPKNEPVPTPLTFSVANDIPKSVSEELPKFQTTPKCRVCNRCGRETRLTREQCDHCSYEDASLGILDSVIAGNIRKVEEILLAKPLVITTRTSKHEWTLLHMAASGGNPRMVEMLIQKGISINAKNKNGKTPLHYAAAKGHKPIVEILLNSHADPTPEYMGETAADMARNNGHPKIVQLLEKAET